MTPLGPVEQLVLASGSPFRRKLLESTGLAFEVKVQDCDEKLIKADEPRVLASRRALAKAMAVAESLRSALVIGADQVLGFAGECLDKVTTPEAASRLLGRLRGKTHHLHSAVTLLYASPDGKVHVLDESVVDVPMPMRPLSEAEIAAYVATGEWQGAVGCYQYEKRGVHLFDAIQAEHSAIVGLPLGPLLARMRALGINGLERPRPPWEIRLS